MRVQYKSGGTTIAAEVESPILLVNGERAWSVVMVGCAPVLTPIDRAAVPSIDSTTEYAPQPLPHVAPDPVTPAPPKPEKGAIDSSGVPFDAVIHEGGLTLDGRWKKKRGRWGLAERGGETARVLPKPEPRLPAPVLPKPEPRLVAKPMTAAREAALRSNSAPQEGGGAGWWYWAESRGKGHYFVYNPGRSLCRKLELHRGGNMQSFKGEDMGDNACPECVLELKKRKEQAEEA